jgi:predicted Zn-dependent protease with MMP-like domain
VPTLPTACDGDVDAGASHDAGTERRLPSLASVTVLEISVDRFEDLVAEALDGIPPELGEHMDNVAVVVHEHGGDPHLLGLYEGIPLTNRAEYGIGVVLPDRITIFRDAILRICRTEADVVRQVRVTVIHEVGHHFGIDDARLHELGWG